MRISELLHVAVVLPSVTSPGKEQVLIDVSARLSDCYPEVDRDGLAIALLKRERLMSTALADGVAIPHARLRGLSRPIAAFGRSQTGIHWDAQDGAPTRLFFVLAVPDDAKSTHLKLLAAVSRLLHDPGCRARLLEARDDALLQTLRAEEERASGATLSPWRLAPVGTTA
jgi:mannitol/fructose-specific phosphotransferase system IIA component (Ntr-type)